MMIRSLIAALICSFTASIAQSQEAEAQRILSIGGTVTEIVYALEQDGRLVARDVTSTYPQEAMALPDVGYMRALAPEGVLSVGADLILVIEGAGPPETLEVLKAAATPVITIPEATSADGVIDKITAVGAALNVPDAAQDLADQVRTEMAAAAEQTATIDEADRKRVLFILSAEGGRIMAGGQDSSADAIIALAGGINAAQGFTGYKLMTDEAVVAAAPDVILMMNRGGNHSVANEVLFSLPALAMTPAAEADALVKMEGLLLLGFGPRTAEAIRGLNTALYGE